MSARVTIIDYGIGNVRSVVSAFAAVGADVNLTQRPADLTAAERVVLPGVGAFGDCVAALSGHGFLEPLRAYFRSDRPFLGICVGMQMMMEWSDEFGHHEGLGLVRGGVKRIPRAAEGQPPYKVPHIGWSALTPAVGGASWQGTMLAGCPEGEPVYFVHSFAADPVDPAARVAEVEYHGNRIAAVIQDGPRQGCQFHPEKSGPAGLAMLRQFTASRS